MGLSNYPCVPFLCVRVKMNEGVVACPKGNVWLCFEPWEVVFG